MSEIKLCTGSGEMWKEVGLCTEVVLPVVDIFTKTPKSRPNQSNWGLRQRFFHSQGKLKN